MAAALLCAGQEENKPLQPQVKVHMLNVCSPTPDEQQEISSALASIPRRPAFSPDFEVDRGRSVLDQNANLLAAAGAPEMPAEAASADFVRIRRDFSKQSVFLSVQYSFSRDSKQMVETLAFRVRDPKDLLQVSIEDSASSVTSPVAMLTAQTPASRIKLERFGKSSIVLARCSGQLGAPAPDQTSYEPLFASGSFILANYRGIMDAKKMVPEELSKVVTSGNRAAMLKKSPVKHQ